MTPVLVFDIETVPDVAGLRRLRAEWSGLADAEVAERAFAERREKTGNDFLPLHLHRVVAISCVLRNDAGFRVGSIGSLTDTEGSLIQAFFGTIDRYTPQLVSWNGGGFDLPVLHYRGLLAGVSAARYWELGDDDRDFRYNNYIGRYHTRHMDLMDLLAMYQPRASAPLDDLSRLGGFRGQARHGRRARVGRVPGRAARADPQLLRDRRRQHLPAVQPVPEDARRADVRASTARKRRWCARRSRICRRRTGRPTSQRGPRPRSQGRRHVLRRDRVARPGGARRRAPRWQGGLHRRRAARRARASTSGARTSRATRPGAWCGSTAPRCCASRRAARTPACTKARAAAARCSTSRRRRRWRSSSACSRTRSGTSAACGRSACCARSRARPGGIAIARASRSATSRRRAACWSASTSARAAMSPTCASARSCREHVSALLVPLRELVGGLTLRERLPQIELAVAEGDGSAAHRARVPRARRPDARGPVAPARLRGAPWRRRVAAAERAGDGRPDGPGPAASPGPARCPSSACGSRSARPTSPR